MTKKTHWKRIDHENLLRKLALEVNKTPLNDNIGYLSDYDLLVLINGFFVKLNLIPYNNDELNRKLSLKN